LFGRRLIRKLLPTLISCRRCSPSRKHASLVAESDPKDHEIQGGDVFQVSLPGPR
jgi:hypothetical protein